MVETWICQVNWAPLPIFHATSDSFGWTHDSYPLSPLFLLFSLRAIYDLWKICGHREERGNMSMKIVCPCWPPLRRNLPHEGPNIPYWHPVWSLPPCKPQVARTWVLLSLRQHQANKRLSYIIREIPYSIHGWDSSRHAYEMGIISDIPLISINQRLNMYKMSTSCSQINWTHPKTSVNFK